MRILISEIYEDGHHIGVVAEPVVRGLRQRPRPWRSEITLHREMTLQFDTRSLDSSLGEVEEILEAGKLHAELASDLADCGEADELELQVPDAPRRRGPFAEVSTLWNPGGHLYGVALRGVLEMNYLLTRRQVIVTGLGRDAGNLATYARTRRPGRHWHTFSREGLAFLSAAATIAHRFFDEPEIPEDVDDDLPF